MVYQKLYVCVRNLSETSPLKRVARQVWRSAVGRVLWEVTWRVAQSLQSNPLNGTARDIYYLDSARIQYDVPWTYVDTYANSVRILHGDWDLPENRVELDSSIVLPPTYKNEEEYIAYHNLEVHRGFYEHFVLEMDWKETVLYKRCLQRLAEGKAVPGFSVADVEQLDAKCSQMDTLFEDIMRNGYKSQHELTAGRFRDEVSVLIGRDGEYLFNDGIHRLSIAKLLHLEAIPVRVDARHSGWVKFRSEIMAIQKRDECLYQPLTHPDLSDIPSIYDDKRWELIWTNLTTKRGKMLDIGANWGYFCHRFEEAGFQCVGVENDPENLYFMRRLRRAENRAFNINDKSIFECDLTLDFDVVLALNVFHWFTRDAKSHEEFVKMLRRLIAKELFLAVPARMSESAVRNHYRDYTAPELVDLILTQSPSLTRARLLGETGGRLLYRLVATDNHGRNEPPPDLPSKPLADK